MVENHLQGDPATVAKGVDLPDKEYTVDVKLIQTLRLMQGDKHAVSKEGWLNSASSLPDLNRTSFLEGSYRVPGWRHLL
jgi:hypothetical protein